MEFLSRMNKQLDAAPEENCLESLEDDKNVKK
jgi:hypothetical protein